MSIGCYLLAALGRRRLRHFLPALARQLTRTAGIGEEVVAGMTKKQAVQALSGYWMSQGQ